MKTLKIAVFLLFVAWLILPVANMSAAKETSIFPGQVPGSIDSDPPPNPERAACRLSEASTGFDDRSINEDFVPDEKHNADNQTIDAFELITDGLGPIYNAQSRRECHQNTVPGGISQVTE